MSKKNSSFRAPSKADAEFDQLMLKAKIDTKYKAKVAAVLKAKATNPDNLALKHFTLEDFGNLPPRKKDGLLQIVNSGVENPSSAVGCYAMQPTDYEMHKPFFSKVLADYHSVPVNATHKSDWTVEGPPLDLARLGLPALSMRVRVGRNLKAFPLPGAMTAADRTAMEAKMCAAFDALAAMPAYGGGYHSLTPGHKNFVDAKGYKKLVDDHLMFKDMGADTYLKSAGIASDWPTGRGCFVSADQKFIVWVGEEDHLRIMCMFKGTKLSEVFKKLEKALEVVSAIPGLEFAFSKTFGNVTSCPTNLGTGMRASVHIKLPNLTKGGSDAKAKAICKPLGLSVRGLGGEHTPIGRDGTVDISPSARFCIKESEIITNLYKGLRELVQEEKGIKLPEGGLPAKGGCCAVM